MTDEVEILLGDAAPCRVVAAFPVLAAGCGKPQRCDLAARGGKRAGAADRAFDTAGAEAVEIVARRFQAVDLDMYRMGDLDARNGLP
jgi:hypothetical protein